jgi:hypothetical protein
LLKEFAEVLDQFGLAKPFIYGAAIYAIFRYLDTQASAQAKNAINGWFKPLEYDKVAVASALVEIFDRLYSRPLLSLRALVRSTVLTLLTTAVMYYETGILEELLPDKRGSYIARILVETSLVANIISDYVSLFFVRRWLLLSGERPVLALITAPLIGLIVVAASAVARQVAIAMWMPSGGSASLVWMRIVYEMPFKVWLLFSLPAIAVHMWLPMFALGVALVKGLNSFVWTVSKLQWFVERGKDRPLETVGYILGGVVFMVTAVYRLF